MSDVAVAADVTATLHAGLGSAEASRRLLDVGPNDIAPASRRGGALAFVARIVADPMVILLAVAAGTYLIFGDRFDAIVIAIALVPIVAVSVILEQRADDALEHLRDMAAPTAAVMRDGIERRIKATEVVPGDILVIEEGDIVAADGFLVAGARLSVDESSLTGESIPVERHPGEGTGTVLAGTRVLAGWAVAEVTRTGLQTQYGSIGRIMATQKPPSSPMERAIRRVVLQVGALVAVACIAVMAARILHGDAWPIALIAAVSLAMAAIPEELPMVYTLYLALGAWRLAKHHALVRRLACVETLGTTTTICVDKTGTLTTGNVRVKDVRPTDGYTVQRLLGIAAAASEARATDPIDAAIFAALGDERPALPGAVLLDEPFDPRTRLTAKVFAGEAGRFVAVKGAFEAVLALCNESADRTRQLRLEHDTLTDAGARALLIADGTPDAFADLRDRSRWNLRVSGLLTFADPVRPTVGAALAACRTAGVRVVMITGDFPATACAIARELGFDAGASQVITGDDFVELDLAARASRVRDAQVFARVRPEQKLAIVQALRADGFVVAMTGDGTNDALALREADIGIAMGRRGTEVARAAADLVLLDDDFATIVAAVRDGRRIFDNLQRALRYLVAFHAPLLVSAVALPLAGAPLLLFPIHLIWLELIVHPTSSLVFESDPGAADVMRRPPRDSSVGLLNRRDWVHAIGVGTLVALATLGVYLGALSLGKPVVEARAIGITTMIVGQLALVFVEGGRATRTLLTVFAGSAATLIVVIYVPFLARAMDLATIPLFEFGGAAAVGVVAAFALSPFEWLARVARAPRLRL